MNQSNTHGADGGRDIVEYSRNKQNNDEALSLEFEIVTESEKDQQMIERAMDLAWAHQMDQVEAIRKCFRYGVRNYEEALELRAKG